ncbi:hypothetical protein PT277_05025 [Acetobacteraceae bacterium ESL0709]|nr:hypothetical protein [Acetobacteraceae bacterium ESL0709]
MNLKLHAVCEKQRRAGRLHLTIGQVNDFKEAEVLIKGPSQGNM